MTANSKWVQLAPSRLKDSLGTGTNIKIIEGMIVLNADFLRTFSLRDGDMVNLFWCAEPPMLGFKHTHDGSEPNTFTLRRRTASGRSCKMHCANVVNTHLTEYIGRIFSARLNHADKIIEVPLS